MQGLISDGDEWLAKRIKAPTHCPRCGRPAVETNRLLALSRRADVTICENCGSWEGLEDAGLAERKPLREWSILQEILTEGLDSPTEQTKLLVE